MARNMIAHGLASQMLAALSMLGDCIDRCPEMEWNEAHGDHPFSQVVFHTLFDCDHGLCDSDGEFREQEFHQAQRRSFGDYDELEDRRLSTLPGRDFINLYLEHCRGRVASVLETRTHDDLITPNSDVYRNMTRIERYMNLIRHVQHHAAQLGLRLQLITESEMDWVGRWYGKDAGH